MRFKKYHLLFVLLLTGTLLHNTCQGQNNIIDSIVRTEPDADTSYQTEEEYDDEYESEETYEDSLQRAETNAFERLRPGNAQKPWRKLPPNYINNLKKDSKFDYVADGIPKPGATKFPEVDFLLTDIWIYVAVIVLLVLLAWYLSANNLLFFRKKSAAIRTITSEELPEDIFSIDYAVAIQQALDSYNYRMAIRLHYLRALKILSEKEIIHYQPDKTNFDYLLQTRATPYYSDFSGLTRQYEYSWYGLFPISLAQYQQVDQLFSNFHKKIGQ